MRNLTGVFTSKQKHITLMKPLKLLLFAFTVLFITGCSTDTGDNYCFQQILTGIDNVTGPDITTVNEPIVLQATFKIYNSCGSFSRFSVSNSFPKTIRAVVNYSGCSCQEMIQEETRPYTFTAPRPGEYILRFVKPDGSFIIKTIAVSN